MRFFSNDARESADEGSDDRPERVQSEPVAVPGQRPPSPWSDAPADDTREATRAGEVTAEDETAATPRHAEIEDDPDRTQVNAPAAASASPADNGWNTTDRDGDAASGAADGRSAAPGDGIVESPSEANTTTYASSNATTDDVVDVPLDDQGTFEDPKVPDSTPPAEAGAQTPAESSVDTPADTLDTPADTSVDESVDEPVDDAADTSVDAPVAVPVETATEKPATKSSEEPDAFFGADDAKALQERWRDVQLRFVDSPKEAAAEAATLVDEAVEKLIAGLRSRKDGLGAESDDTETLRVQLRGYRDILNRIIGL